LVLILPAALVLLLYAFAFNAPHVKLLTRSTSELRAAREKESTRSVTLSDRALDQEIARLSAEKTRLQRQVDALTGEGSTDAQQTKTVMLISALLRKHGLLVVDESAATPPTASTLRTAARKVGLPGSSGERFWKIRFLGPWASVSAGLASSGVQSGDLTFQFASKNFNARLQALESKGQVRMISTPTLLTANNEVSRLFVGEERPLNRSFSGSQAVVGNSTVVTPGTTSIEFRPVGTTLLITPNINADRTVTLRLLQENSNIVTNGASVLVPTNTGFSPQNVDIVQARSVSGTVIARDDVPVVIGGLIDTTLTKTRSQVPILGNIPVVGLLFGQRNNTKTRNELVVVIRPRLVDPCEGGTRASRKFVESTGVNLGEQLQTEKAVTDKLNCDLPAPTPAACIPCPPPASTVKCYNAK